MNHPIKIQLTSIERDPSLQMRANGVNAEIVAEYAEAIRAGATLPPIALFADDKGRHWPGDGWHRIAAVESLGLSEIEADLKPGGRRAALMFAFGANAHHGLRRTNADKALAVRSVLQEPDLRQMSDREIARLCGVDKNTVARVRGEMPGGELLDAKRLGRDGKVQKARKARVAREVVKFTTCEDAPLPKDEPPRVPVMKLFDHLEDTLAEQFKQWPEHKRHAFCVKLYQFCNDHDPEVDEMNRTARQVHNPTVHQILSPKPGDFES